MGSLEQHEAGVLVALLLAAVRLAVVCLAAVRLAMMVVVVLLLGAVPLQP